MKHSYLIIDDSETESLETQKVMTRFPDFFHLHSAHNFEDGLEAILKYKPKIVYLDISPREQSSQLSLFLISEVQRFLITIPLFIVTAKNTELAIRAIEYNVFDYITKPLNDSKLRKSLSRFEKLMGNYLVENSNYDIEIYEGNRKDEFDVEPPFTNEIDSDPPQNCAKVISSDHVSYDDQRLIVCIKSYGDHKYIDSSSLAYLKADNNSTDLYLDTGEVITAFKTLKNFEKLLPLPFLRVHNSFIVNMQYINRIHTGSSLCYLKGMPIKIPFSKSYKFNIDIILSSFEAGNYLEF